MRGGTDTAVDLRFGYTEYPEHGYAVALLVAHI